MTSRARKPRELFSIDYPVEVPFFDVDSMNIAWHGHYCKYFEMARCELLERLDYSYHAMAQTGYGFPIVDLGIRYIQAAHFGQKLLVTASLLEWDVRLKIGYVIRDRLTGEVLTRGHTVQAAVDMKTQTMLLACPEVLKQNFRKHLEG